MYYTECTKAYAVEIIKEIANECSEPHKALRLIENFINNELKTGDLTEIMYEEEK